MKSVTDICIYSHTDKKTDEPFYRISMCWSKVFFSLPSSWLFSLVSPVLPPFSKINSHVTQGYCSYGWFFHLSRRVQWWWDRVSWLSRCVWGATRKYSPAMLSSKVIFLCFLVTFFRACYDNYCRTFIVVDWFLSVGGCKLRKNTANLSFSEFYNLFKI